MRGGFCSWRSYTGFFTADNLLSRTGKHPEQSTVLPELFPSGILSPATPCLSILSTKMQCKVGSGEEPPKLQEHGVCGKVGSNMLFINCTCNEHAVGQRRWECRPQAWCPGPGRWPGLQGSLPPPQAGDALADGVPARGGGAPGKSRGGCGSLSCLPSPPPNLFVAMPKDNFD